jgi:glycosyltransferase involved in cell wall biosynthesis
MMHTSLVPAYNGEQHIRETLDCLIRQSDISHHRIVVSDDCSKDNTDEIVLELQSKIAKDKQLKHKVSIDYVRQTEQLGMVGNWNWLLDQVSSETFTLISQDDLLADPNTISKCQKLISELPNLITVYSNVQLIDTNSTPLMVNKLRPTSGLINPTDTIKQSAIRARNLFGLPLCVSKKLGGHIRYRNEVLYAADIDYAARLSLTRSATSNKLVDSYHIAEPLFYYRVHLQSATSKVQKHTKNDFNLTLKATNIELSKLERIRFEISTRLTPLLRLLVLKSLNLKQKLSKKPPTYT